MLRLRRPTLGGLIKACLVFIVIACVMASQAVAYYDTPGINGIASKLAGRKVTVRCLSKQEAAADPVIAVWGASAYVEGIIDPFTGRWFPFDYAVFDYGICEDLTAIAAGDLSGRLFDNAVWAVVVLTHESGHLKGAKWAGSESRTQCWALQHMKSTLNQLGVRDKAVQSFYYAWALEEIQKDMPAEYQVPDCRLPTP